MHDPTCARGCGEPLAAFPDESGATVLFCATCRLTFCPGSEVARWLGGELALASREDLPLPELDPLPCPRGCGHLRSLSAPFAGTRRCDRCAGLLLEPGVLARLRAQVPRPSRPARNSTPARALPAPIVHLDDALVGARVGFEAPWLDLLALPIAFLCSYLFMLSTLGRLLMVPIQIQFHELGHAIFGWLSSRAALPLPFGFTFWREERSFFTGLCMVFLLGMLGYHGLRERRRFPVLLASALLVCFFALSCVVSARTSLMLMLWGGIAGELVLPALVLVAFRFPMPDRLRWDFFRFVVILPAAGTWLAAAQLWIGVSRGTRFLPMGSLLGTPGDGSGDLDRLIASHDFSELSVARSYLSLTLISAAILVLHYGYHAVQARVRLARTLSS